jgi:hypothetical protein
VLPQKHSVYANRFLRADVFRNAANWYPWFFWDWIGGGKIQVYCEVDQPNKENVKCATTIPGESGSVAAYISNLNKKSVIVFCAPFFTLRSLDQVKKDLDAVPSKQHDATWMKSTGHAFFHEMTHLSVIEDQWPSEFDKQWSVIFG